MAPVKRSTTTVQRETRSTRGAVAAKQRSTTTETQTASPTAKKVNVDGKNVTAARRGRKHPDSEIPVVDDSVMTQEKPRAEAKSKRSQTSKESVIKSAGNETTIVVNTRNLAAAPRRRIKITPLDTPEVQPKEENPQPTRSTVKEAASTKKASTRTQKAKTSEQEARPETPNDEEPTMKAVKTRSTRRAPTEATTSIEVSCQPKIKTRGRPKKDTIPTADSVQGQDVEVAPVARTTRSKRTASTSVKASDDAEPAVTVRSTTGTRKKVTFQDLPHEDEKENIPLTSSKSKKTTASKQNAVSATGLRAKPIRKPASAGVTKSKKSTGSAATKTAKASEKRMPTALTPKKITQVAKSVLPNEDEEISDGEDELNGGKTPLRDLSMSPRRPPTSALGRALSPAKKLDFGQTLVANSMQSTECQKNNGSMMSPARRPPASPFKDGLKDSPKRSDASRILFPTNNHLQHDATASIALNPANIASASHNMSTLLQSPKRNGILDAGFFSQSAMKKSVGKSSLKTSLLASPARRLFSPNKKSTIVAPSKISEVTLDAEIEVLEDDKPQSNDALSEEPEGDFIASSHFRASSSPIRVHKVELMKDNDNFDFDESVLQVRSPLKIKKSPIKQKLNIVLDCGEATAQPIMSNEMGNDTQSPEQASVVDSVVNPAKLDLVPQPESPWVIENTKQPDDDDDLDEQTTDMAENMSTAHHVDEVIEGVPLSNLKPYTDKTVFTVLRSQEGYESSEDELAADQTPVRLLTRSRSSLGQSVASEIPVSTPYGTDGNHFGFTPLAARIDGWQASSPEKTAQISGSHLKTVQRQPSLEFSPLASQHVDGQVMISRHSTPVQKLDLRKSLNAQSVNRSAATGRKSLGLRKSLAQRQSLLDTPRHDSSYLGESPTGDAHFEEYMEMRALDEETDDQELFNLSQVGEANRSFDEIMNTNDNGVTSDDDEGDTVLVDKDINDDVAGELTTDLVKFTHASDTAMVDFQKLAEEAQNMAPTYVAVNAVVMNPQTTSEPTGVLDNIDIDDECDRNGTTPPASCSVKEVEGFVEQLHEQSFVYAEVASPILQPSTTALESPSVLVIDPASSPSSSAGESNEIMAQQPSFSTPVMAGQRQSSSRLVKTVISKVPLKPEGQLSPIKMRKKRARSFGSVDGPSNKRVSFGTLKEFTANRAQETVQSPDRNVRTSVAPSPGGTSTPASRYARTSIGGNSDVVTPGQVSFGVDDFGDSTLDGIELPDEYDHTTLSHFIEENATPTVSRRIISEGMLPDTPATAVASTPMTSKKGVRQAITPAIAKRTPAAPSKTPALQSTKKKVERAPLSPVGKGLLDGAVVFVDVYTSEGADASGIFVELLTQMGARCVKEWRWNPRASLPANREGELGDTSVGITHVIYKDGGKRTLEKVRDAKGQVCCVGVAWVLDCEREGKWLDESIYAIDTAMMPRGGSNRRKSMEPRALLVGENGSVSASKARRSVSAEMNELMKRELINTPARGQQQKQQFFNDTEGDSDEENQDQATPTGYISYDPRTAMTPGTPYLVNQGKKLIQMSAPPKQQTGKRLFEDDDDGNDVDLEDQENDASLMMNKNKEDNGVVKDAKKFRMKNLDMKARRRTLGFKPVVGSPLAK